MLRYWKSVAPFVGAWIEIDMAAVIEWLDYVAPFVGAWIEIIKYVYGDEVAESLPSWERGLKLHLLAGCV